MVGRFRGFLQRRADHAGDRPAHGRQHTRHGDYTRTLRPSAGRRAQDDFLGALARAEAAGTLSEDEIVGNVMLLLLAGHVAVRNLVGNLLWLLLTHPEQHRLLRADLGLMHGAIEEAPRFEPPVTLIPRVALTEIELRDRIDSQKRHRPAEHRRRQS